MSRRRFLPLALALLIAPANLLRAADDAKPQAPQTLDVWPGVAPGEASPTVPEPDTADPSKTKKITGVTHPTITIFRPEPAADTGVAVVVCPGGGYRMLAYDYEGEDLARWLNTLGITGVVLKYRVPPHEGVPRWQAPLQDAQRTLSFVRSKAQEWKLNPNKIGMLGFSAGGHLTCAASTNFEQRAYPPIDAIDRASCRPDFAIVIYPGGVIEKGKTEISPELKVIDKTPPAFIVQANDDPVNSENAVYYYLALKQAKVPAELHIYAKGGHGFGMRKSDNPCSTWPARCEEWMVSEGIIAKK